MRWAPAPTDIIRRMDTVVPFRAWRYAPAAGDPALLVAPPYDVIGPALQSRSNAALTDFQCLQRILGSYIAEGVPA